MDDGYVDWHSQPVDDIEMLVDAVVVDSFGSWVVIGFEEHSSCDVDQVPYLALIPVSLANSMVIETTNGVHYCNNLNPGDRHGP